MKSIAHRAAAPGACSFLFLFLSLQVGCVPRKPGEGESPREPLRWILVERRYGDLETVPPAGDGRINPEARVLAFQPLYAEDLSWEARVNPGELQVELLELSPRGTLAPGDWVTASLRVARAEPQERYRLSASPSEKGVEIQGAPVAYVTGSETARFRFTSARPGSAGIRVGVERVGGEGP